MFKVALQMPLSRTLAKNQPVFLTGLHNELKNSNLACINIHAPHVALWM